MRIAISAEIEPGQDGGIEQVLIGLLRGLGELTDGNEQYVIVGAANHSEWLAPYIASNQTLIARPIPAAGRFQAAKRLLGPARRPTGAAWRRLRHTVGHKQPYRPPELPTSDGFYESLGADVLHITYPLHFFMSEIPTVFSMYDLQHRHLPQLFSPQHLAWREWLYPAAFGHARATVANSRWVQTDIVEQYGVPAEHVYVAPLASVTDAYGPVSELALRSIRERLKLPDGFLLYPALAYEHKNHLGLLEAIALLRDEGHVVHVICTGKQKLFWPAIERRWHELGLESQVRFLGFVSPQDLRALYCLAHFLIFPTLFEGAGLPLLESLREGTPVACSDLPPLREYGGEATVYFDPRSTRSISEAILRLTLDHRLRDNLRIAAEKQSARFTWRGTASIYRALYRQAADASLTEEDVCLIRTASYADALATATRDRGSTLRTLGDH